MDTIGFESVPARNTNVVLGDSYVIDRRIGRGAMGEVYLASHVRLPGQFAVKLLLPELQGNQEAFARFCREAEIMSQLRHPNIVQIFDFNVAADGRPYFVMEYLQGRDLEARLQAGPLPLPAVTRIVDAVSSALALAHAHGVVHRDLKPANIFLAAVDGQTDELIKVLDFGISKVRAAAPQISHAVDVLGTPSYMAPEQARGQAAAIDGRTDQFAVGALAYRMLTGQEPFHGEDTAAVLYQVVHEDPPPLSLFLPADWDPGPLQAVLSRALAKHPEQRFGGMMELARAFDDAAERTIGAAGAGGLRAQAAQARRLDDADIDVPPPVRTPTPLVTAPTPAPSLPAPPAQTAAPLQLRPKLRPTPPLNVPRVLDWEVPDNVDEVPKTRTRAVVLTLLALGIVAVVIATGWYRKLPGASAVREKIHEWTGPSGGARQSAAPAAAPETAEPEPAPPAAAPPPAATAPPEEPARADEAPAAAAPQAAAPEEPAAQKPRAKRRTAARNNQPRRAATTVPPVPPVAPLVPDAPAAAPVGTAPPTMPSPGTPPVNGPPLNTPPTQTPPLDTAPALNTPPVNAAPTQTPPTGTPPLNTAPTQTPPTGTPANPPLNGGAFEIAPPTPMQPRQDLAPPPVGEPPPPRTP
jgi:serine/threonine-protein kinase